eukprot:scaffold76184_cov18-Prasinocladus_malaysianus.AAC.1
MRISEARAALDQDRDSANSIVDNSNSSAVAKALQDEGEYLSTHFIAAALFLKSQLGSQNCT